MHPANICALQAANIHHAGQTNSHSLDFDEPGLLERVKTIKSAGIALASAGRLVKNLCALKSSSFLGAEAAFTIAIFVLLQTVRVNGLSFPRSIILTVSK